MKNAVFQGKELIRGDILKWSDVYGSITGIVKFGEWEQDGSGGEYPGTLCLGYYVKATKIEPHPSSSETIEELLSYYPEYLKNISLMELINSSRINNLKYV